MARDIALLNWHAVSMIVCCFGIQAVAQENEGEQGKELDELSSFERPSLDLGVDGLGIGVFLNTRYTNNARKTDQDEQADTIYSYGLNLDYIKQSRALNSNINYHLVNNSYVDDSFDDESILTGSSSFLLSTTPDRYSWMLGHQQSVNLQSFSDTNSPDNRVERSNYITGPNLNLKLSPVDVLAIQLRHINTRVDKSDINDSERGTADVRIRHNFNRSHSASLVGNYSDVKFDLRANDYEQQSLGLDFVGQYRRGRYQLGFGVTEIERNDADKTDDHYLRVAVGFHQDLASWNFRYTKEVTDSSVGLSLNQAFGGGGQIGEDNNFGDGEGNFELVDVIFRTFSQLSYTRRSPDSRLGLLFRVNQSENDYERQLEDTKTLNGFAALNYGFAQNLDGRIELSYKLVEFSDRPILGEDELMRATVGLNHSLGESFTLRYELGYEVRENPDDINREYKAGHVSLNVGYRWQ